MPPITNEEKTQLRSRSRLLDGLPETVISQLLDLGEIVTYPANTFISEMGRSIEDPAIVLSGLIRVSACSESGKRITFLLVKEGEIYNMLGPYLNQPRILEAIATQKTRCLCFKGQQFKDFVASHPPLVNNILRAIGGALDIANSRILDMMDKKVDQRIMRVLNSLHEKFGSPILFTSNEISELAGTTAESTLRVMATLRELNIVETSRGKIWIKRPESLRDSEFGNIFGDSYSS